MTENEQIEDLSARVEELADLVSYYIERSSNLRKENRRLHAALEAIRKQQDVQTQED